MDQVKGSWSVVAGAFLSMFTVFGVAYSFGAFFTEMAAEFDADSSRTALFFSITTFVYFLLGMVSGPAVDRWGPRPLLAIGAVALGVGLLATAEVPSLEWGYVTYGAGVGIGVACGYVPMVAVVGGWFRENRATALGIAVAGIGVGTLVMAPVAERLIDAYGWRQTYRILAVGSVGLLAVAAVLMKPAPAANASPTSLGLGEVLRTSRSFRVLFVSNLGVGLALFVPFVFLGDYVDRNGIDGSGGLLVGLIGVSSVAGRLGLGALASRFPVHSLYRLSVTGLGASFALWWLAGDSYAALMLFTVVLGVTYGGFIALAPAVAAEEFGTAALGGLLGALYVGAGLGGLVGPPVAGLLIDGPGYRTTIALAGFVGVAAGLVLVLVGRERPTIVGTP